MMQRVPLRAPRVLLPACDPQHASSPTFPGLATAAGHEVYVVGGTVRDLLLGGTPKDFDILSSADPHQVGHMLARWQCDCLRRMPAS